jgi:DNA-directed RNA polymerase specialized sigma24 family protein
MTADESVTAWLARLEQGDRQVVEHLWQRYFQRLVQVAGRKLGGVRAGADAEDVALSAFDTFCRRAEQGQFPELADREGLWRLLAAITARKAWHLVRDQGRQKRGGPGPGPLLEEVIGREPGPDALAEMMDEYRRLLRCLPEPDLAAVAVWKMEGYSVEEIAHKLGCSPRSVKRKLRLIRDLWVKEADP